MFSPLRMMRSATAWSLAALRIAVALTEDPAERQAVRESFEPAPRRLALTGTPFRSDINPIPFVTYAPDDDGDGKDETGQDANEQREAAARAHAMETARTAFAPRRPLFSVPSSSIILASTAP